MNEQIIRDLISKISNDVTRAMTRTLSIAPSSILPIAIAGGAASIGVICAVLVKLSDRPADERDESTIILAALLCAHIAIDPTDGVDNAYRDLNILRPLPTKPPQDTP